LLKEIPIKSGRGRSSPKSSSLYLLRLRSWPPVGRKGIMTSEIIEYRGYELHIEPYESGFKARLRKSGSLFDRPELPYSENKTQREQMIAEAKAIVDTLR